MLSNPTYVCYVKKNQVWNQRDLLRFNQECNPLLNEFYTGPVKKQNERHTPEYRYQENSSGRNAIDMPAYGQQTNMAISNSIVMIQIFLNFIILVLEIINLSTSKLKFANIFIFIKTQSPPTYIFGTPVQLIFLVNNPFVFCEKARSWLFF